MRRIRLMGLALMAIFAFGVVAAATASATEPAGILYLPEQTGPVTLKGEGGEVKLTTLGLKKIVLTSTHVKVEGTIGAGEGTHSTLGTLQITYEGVKLEKVACSSENIKGEKDAKEVVLQVTADTDIHLVSLLNGTVLVPGILVGLLELVEGAKKLDLTLNCAGVKVLILGAQFLEVEGATAGKDLEEVKVKNSKLTCDTADELCKKELASWGATATKKNGEKDEKVLCPLASFVEAEEECSELNIPVAIPTKFSKDVLLDF